MYSDLGVIYAITFRIEEQYVTNNDHDVYVEGLWPMIHRRFPDRTGNLSGITPPILARTRGISALS